MYFVGTPNDYIGFILHSVSCDSVQHFIYLVYFLKSLSKYFRAGMEYVRQ